MGIGLQAAAENYANEHPAIVGFAEKCEAEGWSVALTASGLHQVVATAEGWPVRRAPDDADFLVRPGDLDSIAGLLGVDVVTREVRFDTGDGLSLNFMAREVTTQLGRDRVQLMDPLTSVRCGGHEYNTTLTDQAVAARTVVETGRGRLPLAHRATAVGLYAISQRPKPKEDEHNTAGLLIGGVLMDPDTHDLAREMRWDHGRVWPFVLRAGAAAATRTVEARRLLAA